MVKVQGQVFQGAEEDFSYLGVLSLDPFVPVLGFDYGVLQGG